MKIKSVETGEVLDVYGVEAYSGSAAVALVFRDGQWERVTLQAAQGPGETRVYWVPAVQGVDY